MTNNNKKMFLDDIMQDMLFKMFNLKNIDLNNYSDKYILSDEDDEVEKIDLTTDEGFEKYNNLIDQLNDLVSGSPFFKTIIDEEDIESLRKFGEGIHERANEPDTEPTVENCDEEKELCDMNCNECELDYCVHPEVNCEECTCEQEICNCCSGTCRKEIDETVNEDFDIPSEKIKNIDIKLQIHRLTQKYIDEMVKPYLGEKNNKQINDAYSALYEFACWIYSQNNI